MIPRASALRPRYGPAFAGLVLVGAALLAGCASSTGPITEAYDPLESVNRPIFSFNDHLSRWIIEPIASGYDHVVPDRVQTAIANFYANLNFPVVFANELLQGKPRAAGVEFARFSVNTTVGVAGFFDPAAHFGLKPHDEDFGQTLGVWGFGPGPYLVLPFLGPSDVRDALGKPVDTVLSVYEVLAPFYATTSVDGLKRLNEVSILLPEIRQARASAFDYYVFVRNAYTQLRQAEVRDSTAASEQKQEDLYHPDDSANP